MTSPAARRQWLTAGNRLRTSEALRMLPDWTRVRIAGCEPAEIRNVEQLLMWLEAYARLEDE